MATVYSVFVLLSIVGWLSHRQPGSMTMLTRRHLLGSLAALSLPSLATSAAEQWPKKLVRMIYPYAAGSSVDGAARLFARRFGEVFGQPFVLENRTGANGALAVEAVARAPADGHVLLWAP